MKGRSGGLSAAAGAGLVIALLLAAACGVFLWEPWHGPVIVTLSKSHGIDAGDLPALPLVALALGVGLFAAGKLADRRPWWGGPRAAALAAVLLGALLLSVGFVADPSAGSLVPAGGGTFDGRTEHVDGPEASPVGRWTHLAVTYDGETLRLYVDGAETSHLSLSGGISRTAKPLWIGGDRPFGEYFAGVIDEVRIYDRALSPGAVRTEMSTPIAGRGSPRALAAAYAFNTDSGTAARDSSGRGNAGEVMGASWTTHGRFGGAVRFSGDHQMVRVPASTSLDLRDAMTLSAWVRPTKAQSGWRAVIYRQRDIYFLTAGGGNQHAARLGAIDDVRGVLLTIAALWFVVGLVGSGGSRNGRPPSGYWPLVALFLGGCVIDAAFSPSVTLFGPMLAAAWCGYAASGRAETVIMYAMAAAFVCVTVLSAGSVEVELWDGHAGVARSAALGLLLLGAGVLRLRQDRAPVLEAQ